jgi:hypothetical protein
MRVLFGERRRMGAAARRGPLCRPTHSAPRHLQIPRMGEHQEIWYASKLMASADCCEWERLQICEKIPSCMAHMQEMLLNLLNNYFDVLFISGRLAHSLMEISSFTKRRRTVWCDAKFMEARIMHITCDVQNYYTIAFAIRP